MIEKNAAPAGILATMCAAVCLCVVSVAGAQGVAQPSGPAAAAPAPPGRSLDEVSAQIADQIRELRTALDAVREQLAGSRLESADLREQLRTMRTELDSLHAPSQAPSQAAGAPDAEPSVRDRVDMLAEEQDLLRAKVEDQEQTKIESGSKHHVRLSGLVLLNVASTIGSVDDLDLPAVAQPRPAGDSGGGFGAGARQSRLGLEVFGPTLGGAKTTADLAFDFFGGFPATHDGVSSPRVRLRTATFSIDWTRASVVAGQDVPFFSPRSPTSLASTAYPALSAAGNLWTWTPQVHVDHRIALSDNAAMVVQWGVLDPLTGELPAGEYNRMATAGERSRIPAQAAHVGWQFGPTRPDDPPRRAAAGVGAYHARQDWGFGRTVEAWAATTDWDVPIGRWLALSGELYRGRAIGGLGGGVSDSVLFDGPETDPASAVRPVDSAGGWGQIKFKPAARVEFNAAFGEDHPFQTGLSRFLTIGSVNGSAVNRNASGFLNAIYQARSNLLFSVEYRQLWTTSPDEATRTAGHVSFSTGIGF